MISSKLNEFIPSPQRWSVACPSHQSVSIAYPVRTPAAPHSTKCTSLSHPPSCWTRWLRPPNTQTLPATSLWSQLSLINCYNRLAHKCWTFFSFFTCAFTLVYSLLSEFHHCLCRWWCDVPHPPLCFLLASLTSVGWCSNFPFWW